jgi:hypothetical protein
MIGKKWQQITEPVSVARARALWRDLPPAEWSVPRVMLMAALFAITGTVLWHCEGNPWVFCFGTVTAGQVAGAAVGVPYRRISQGALCGSMLGLAFFVYAVLA